MRWMALVLLVGGASLYGSSPEIEQAVPPGVLPALPEEQYLTEFDRLHALLMKYRYEADYFSRRARETVSPTDARRADYLVTQFQMKKREIQEQMMQLEFDRISSSEKEANEEVR